MRIVLLGAPGSGKGTQAAMLKAELQIPHISTGDLLRAAVAAGSPLGLKAKAVMDAGQLVSDETVLDILEERLRSTDVCNGFILDGYPRNLQQCAALEGLLERIRQPLDIAVKLKVPTDLLIYRIAGRADAECRKDDKPETVRERLRVYQEQTAPVAKHFDEIGKLVVIDGVGELDDIFRRIRNALPRAQATA